VARGKLVRDQIPAIIAARGGVPVTRTAEAEEYRQLLRDKLAEEVGEAASAGPGDLAGELADVLEAVAAIAAEAGSRRSSLRTSGPPRQPGAAGSATGWSGWATGAIPRRCRSSGA
jgi:predicted house-cleaning noncanonical NTP pyrophosphatase (MazG superfamily)